MKRLTLVTGLLVLASTAPATADTRCVGSGQRCAPTLHAAVDAARAGDVIRLGRGTFAGGVTLARSVTLAGEGAGATTILGGGPVLTIAPSAHDVTIKDVTITGGVTTKVGRCSALCGTNYEQATSLGGGISIPPGADGAAGATVTVRDSVIAGNRAAPVVNVPSVRATCASGPCPFGLGGGGGIENWGALTLIDTRVSDNQAGGERTSDAEGGGILNGGGSLTLRHSVITRNRAVGTLPNGRFAEGGGIFMTGGTLSISDSIVTDNVADLVTSMLATVDTVAHAGGIHHEGAGATIRDTVIARNTAQATNAVGNASAYAGGLQAEDLDLRDSSVSENRVRATASSPSGAAFADTGGIGLGGTAVLVKDTRVMGNRVDVSAQGFALAAAGAVNSGSTGQATIRESLLADNSVEATSATDDVVVQGAGIFNIGVLALRDTAVRGNRGAANGHGGVAEGGGIWNGTFDDFPVPAQLSLTASTITGNALTAPAAVTITGGGLFTTSPVTLHGTLIAHNAPDQCEGC